MYRTINKHILEETNEKDSINIGNYWTYGTLKPSGATLDVIGNTENPSKYLKCFVPPVAKSTTSKAQLARKFPPYGIDNSYNGITAIYSGDRVTISFKMFINNTYIPNGNVYFLDLEDSTSNNRGIRFLINKDDKIGVNRDKILSNNPILYAVTEIPIDEWFDFKTEIKIGENDGHYKIWINNAIVLDKYGVSFINNLNFYDSVMVGVTGTLLDSEFSISIDDFLFEVSRKEITQSLR
jgi:hypothetical protein